MICLLLRFILFFNAKTTFKTALGRLGFVLSIALPIAETVFEGRYFSITGFWFWVAVIGVGAISFMWSVSQNDF